MIIESIKKRRSIRKYDADGIVTDEQIKELLEAAMLAPSACNTRPWEFIVVKDRTYLDRITAFHRHAQMLKTASAAIVVCALPETQNRAFMQKGVEKDPLWQQDCAAATQNILLQAAELGLGTCWSAIYPFLNFIEGARKLFDLPQSKVPFCVIAVGVPAEDFGSRGFYEESKVRWIK